MEETGQKLVNFYCRKRKGEKKRKEKGSFDATMARRLRDMLDREEEWLSVLVFTKPKSSSLAYAKNHLVEEVC